MTARAYNYQAPPALAIAAGATTPNPGIVGVSVWSTTENREIYWNGTSWQLDGPQLSLVAPATVGAANAVGAAVTVARADHVHAHGAQTDGTMHAAATTSIAGFLSAADKTKLDGIATGATAGPGLSSTSPASVGTTNTVGVGTTAARADHVHAHGVQTDPTLHADATASTDGFMSAAQFTRLANVYQRPIFPMTFSGGLGTGYQFVLADAERIIGLTNTAGTASTMTVQADIFTFWPSGAQLVVTVLPGTNNIATLVAGSGVTLTRAPGASLTLFETMQTAILTKVGTNLWQVDNVRYASPTAPEGSADSGKVPLLGSAGKLDKGFLNAVTVSAGAADVGKVPLLNGSGKIDASCLASSGLSTVDSVEFNATRDETQQTSIGSLFAYDLGGYVVPGFCPPVMEAGAVSRSYALQPSAFSKKSLRWIAGGGGNGTVLDDGLKVSTYGSAQNRALSTASVLSAMHRLGFATTATANAVAGLVGGGANALWGDIAGRGGFLLYGRFGIATAISSGRWSFGLAAATVPDPFNQISLEPNVICLGIDSGDTQLQLITRGPSVLNKVALADTGVRTVGAIYDMFIRVNAGQSTIGYGYKRVDLGPTQPWTVGVNTPPANSFPAPGTPLNPRCVVHNNISVATAIDISHIVMESDL